MRHVLMVVVAAALAAPAFAGDPAAVRSVAFNDLNLSSADGRLTLERRIERAARAICAVNPVTETQAVADARTRCVEATIAATTDQVNAAINARATQTAGL